EAKTLNRLILYLLSQVSGKVYPIVIFLKLKYDALNIAISVYIQLPMVEPFPYVFPYMTMGNFADVFSGVQVFPINSAEIALPGFSLTYKLFAYSVLKNFPPN